MSDNTIDLNEARAMFSRPEAEQAPKQRKPQRRDSAATEATEVKAAGEDHEGKERMAVMMAKKRNQKYAIMEQGGDALLLFGKHSGSKVSLLASVPDGRDYLRWMMNQEFAPELLKVIRSWLARMI